MDELFIECVKQYPCLWNTKLPSYKKINVKHSAWKDILNKTNLGSVSIAKMKWKNLRDTHREAFKKHEKTKNGEIKTSRKTWKYMSQMEFLLPYMNIERDTDITPPQSLSSAETAFVETYSTGNDPDTTRNKVDEISYDVHVPQLFKKIEDNREKRYAHRENLPKELSSNIDPLKAFFDSMYQSTKQMPESYQRIIKRKLFHLVIEAEDNLATADYSHAGYFLNDSVYNSRADTTTNHTNYFSKPDSNNSPESKYLQQSRED